MIKINLLPVREKAKKENIRKQISIGVLLVVLSLAVLGYMTLAQYSELNSKKEEKARSEKQLADLKKEVGDVEQLKKEKAALEKRKEAIANLSRNRLGLVKALDQVTRERPKALYFVTVEQKSGPAPWEDFGLTISGIATDNEVVAQFMREIQKEKAVFKSVDLDFTRAKTVQKDAGAFQEFLMNVQVAQEKPAAPPAGPAKTPPPPAGPAKKS
jgi:type IV pilus assembly protein PilN